jgi:hypothetical protein
VPVRPWQPSPAYWRALHGGDMGLYFPHRPNRNLQMRRSGRLHGRLTGPHLKMAVPARVLPWYLDVDTTINGDGIWS